MMHSWGSYFVPVPKRTDTGAFVALFVSFIWTPVPSAAKFNYLAADLRCASRIFFIKAKSNAVLFLASFICLFTLFKNLTQRRKGAKKRNEKTLVIIGLTKCCKCQ